MDIDVEYAECRRFDNEDGSYSLFYMVYNGETIGSYRTDYNRYGEVGEHASRDYHRIASKQEIEAYNNYSAYQAESDEVQAQMEKEGIDPDYAWYVSPCMWHQGSPQCICDGSYMVEVTTDDKHAYMIAAMMAER